MVSNTMAASTTIARNEKSSLDSDDDYTSAMSHLTIGVQIQELSKRLQNTTEELHQQVRDKHGALLQQATHAGRFDAALNSLAEDVQRVRATGHRLKSQVDNQYQLVENQTQVLGRLHDVSHLLRSAGTLLTLTAKLKNTKDVLRQAELHFELGQLIEDKDLKDIEFIQEERAYVLSSRQKIRNLTQMQLVTGLQERNQTQVVNALKIFMNFNTLEKSLENLLATFIADMEQSLKECFAGTDISVLNKADAVRSPTHGGNSSTKAQASRGPGKAPQLTTTQNFRAKFWKSLHWLLYDELYESCTQIKLLKLSLEQINQFGYTSESSDQCIPQRFWQRVQQLLRKSFDECTQHVNQTLQEGLSKLLTSARGLEQRLNNEFQFDNELFAPLEVGYVSKCAANLKACLAGVDLPGNETVDNFIRVASTELSAALIDSQLSNAIANVFIACGKELCTKLEAQIKLSADSKQVVDLPNLQQQQNTQLANVLYYYKDSVRRMLSDLQMQFERTPSAARSNIARSLDQADLLIGTILQQIMESIITAISIIILSMHREPGLNTDRLPTTGPSMYMKELQEFVTRSWSHHIELFDDKEMTGKCGQELAKRCIELFIHNLCILRPLSMAGRQRLKHDCQHMEQALKPLCPNFAELGKPSRLLRAMSLLIVQSAQELVKQSVGADSLVPSYVVLLLMFGHAGAELQSPHTTANWSNERLIEWLDGHTAEREKLELISGALQRYRDNARRKNIQQYDEIYPMMVDYFEKALKAISV
ncbi:conserved oligomeric Golgi complex subunit 5 isoform X1 [Drosophila hydei]|uniref:Conserved oligomeric Golgi complex subunit 5 n=2 Tax=Drosophila hydei TaxID=7224 RepID=A0A6J2SVN2_DROHY|nr:conserved oligomeric Golgi complex subunit 5 isoform X1 [Drosophila hydei]XP_030080257.1 conserved oligomeric Golgi complex subunit 5 isoform X1 [Drosophila hydei]